ncbi:MAG TPA: DUF4861 family protein [Terriglobales bacterium]|nr:DUF4861 family protein [Terriglobales bacterium]
MSAAFRTAILIILTTASAWATPHLRGVKLSITNSTDMARPHENMVIPLTELRRVAPDLNAGQLLVTATDATSIEEDSAILQATEIPSQVDDIDGDNKADELAFQIDLKPKQTRIVTVTYGEANRICRLRSEYPDRTHALLATKIEGIGWESEYNGWRLYFDPRNAIDLYGKQRHSLLLRNLATPEYDYHSVSPYGRDIYKIGNALGIGAVGAWVDGKLIKVADVGSRNYRIVSTGPVRAIVDIVYTNWNVAGRKLTLRSRITQWANERGFYHNLDAKGGDGLVFATGLPLKKNVPEYRSSATSGPIWVATYGEQVLMPGATATEALTGTQLGLGIVLLERDAKTAQDADNHLISFSVKQGHAAWYVMAAWDQEGTEDRVSVGSPDDIRRYVQRDGPRIASREEFLQFMKDTAVRLSSPVTATVLSSKAEAQSAPPDTLKSKNQRTYAQAISLLQKEIDRTAAQWEPVLKGSDTIATNKGDGFFTEGNNQTGKWQKQNGFFWTGSFWTGELWKMYEKTHDEKYRQWGELWTRALMGKELEQNHDSGFLYFYSSVPAFELTKNAEFRESALRGAQRLEQLYNPKTQLIAAWSVGGDDTIVDTMMNLQLLWWAWKQTGDEKWKDIGINHALQTAKRLVRPDGSTFQSVHYNPGDDRQQFQLRGGAPMVELKWKNNAAPGETIFRHTHQGFTADTSWSRGQAWALYGFAAAYQETKDPRLLQTAESIASYILRELPEDNVPWYDFYDEGVIYRNRDTSAAAVTAGGLLRLSQGTSDAKLATQYRQTAEKIVQSLINRYLTPVSAGDSTPEGVLRHGSSTRPGDTPLIYGQYYLLETLLDLERQSGARRAAQ